MSDESPIPHLASLPPLSGPLEWARGPARLRDGDVEIVEPSSYMPADESLEDLPFDLAGIRSPDEAVAFARRWGLLRTPPNATARREPFADWKTTAAALRDALALYSAVRAGRDGDEEAVEWARRIMGGREWTTSPEFRAQLDGLTGTLAKADASVAAILTAGVAEVRVRVQPASLVEYPSPDGRRRGEVGDFLFAPGCQTLAQLAFHLAAVMVTMRVDVRTCPDPCRRSFVPKHGAQVYCRPEHANAARARRHRRSQAA